MSTTSTRRGTSASTPPRSESASRKVQPTTAPACRPASVVLAVLVDRGGRELPIEAACAVARLSLPAGERIELARDEAGRFTFEIR